MVISYTSVYFPWDFCNAAISVARVVDVSTASISALLKLALSSVCTPAIVVPPGEQTSSFNWKEKSLDKESFVKTVPYF